MYLYELRDDQMHYLCEYIPKRTLREDKKQTLAVSSLYLLKHSLSQNLKDYYSLFTHVSDVEDLN